MGRTLGWEKTLKEQDAGVTIVITCHTPRVRSGLLSKSLESVFKQSHLPDAVAIAMDHYHQGAAVTRNKALWMANTEWIVFLDSDDILYPNYLQRVFEEQLESGADVVWPWYKVRGCTGRGEPYNPLEIHMGRQWNQAEPHSFPITTLVRTEFAIKAGGFPMQEPAGPYCLGEDFPFWVRLGEIGAKFHHFPERLWEYNHCPEGGNTSGMPNRW